MDYMDFRWSLLEVYMESTWSPQGLVGECQVQQGDWVMTSIYVDDSVLRSCSAMV
jgi:hypothetical protein